LQIAAGIERDRIHSILIDTKPVWDRPHDMPRIADALGGTYHRIDNLKAANVVDFISGF
jgi:Mg-chelatase subunit ChlD